MAEWLHFHFSFHALEKEMATPSSVLAWRIPRTGKPGGLPSMGSHRVGHDWSDLAVAAAILYDDQPKENVQISTCYLNVCENIWNDIHLAPCYNYIRSSLVHEKHIHISDPKNYCKIQISCSKHFNSHINISVQGFKYHESNQILLLGKSPR